MRRAERRPTPAQTASKSNLEELAQLPASTNVATGERASSPTIPPSFERELAQLGTLIDKGYLQPEIAALAAAVADGSARRLTNSFHEAWNAASKLPHLARVRQVERVRRHPLLWEAGQVVWRHLSVESPSTDPFASTGTDPLDAISPSTAAAVASPERPPLVSEDARTTLGWIGGAIGFFLGLGAGGIGALPGAWIGALLGYYLPEVGGCAIVAVVVIGVFLLILVSSFH